jgi:hypothetical protein
METAMQELKNKIQHAIEESNGELSEYKAGYKQCLINIQNDIDSQMLQVEIDQRKNDFRAGWHGNKHKAWNCEYYMAKHLTNDFKSE